MKLAWRGRELRVAVPRALQPTSSISRPAESPGGFLKVEPALLPCGWVRLPCARYSRMRRSPSSRVPRQSGSSARKHHLGRRHGRARVGAVRLEDAGPVAQRQAAPPATPTHRARRVQHPDAAQVAAISPPCAPALLTTRAADGAGDAGPPLGPDPALGHLCRASCVKARPRPRLPERSPGPRLRARRQAARPPRPAPRARLPCARLRITRPRTPPSRASRLVPLPITRYGSSSSRAVRTAATSCSVDLAVRKQVRRPADAQRRVLAQRLVAAAHPAPDRSRAAPRRHIGVLPVRRIELLTRALSRARGSARAPSRRLARHRPRPCQQHVAGLQQLPDQVCGRRQVGREAGLARRQRR